MKIHTIALVASLLLGPPAPARADMPPISTKTFTFEDGVFHIVDSNLLLFAQGFVFGFDPKAVRWTPLDQIPQLGPDWKPGKSGRFFFRRRNNLAGLEFSANPIHTPAFSIGPNLGHWVPGSADRDITYFQRGEPAFTYSFRAGALTVHYARPECAQISSQLCNAQHAPGCLPAQPFSIAGTCACKIWATIQGSSQLLEITASSAKLIAPPPGKGGMILGARCQQSGFPLFLTGQPGDEGPAEPVGRGAVELADGKWRTAYDRHNGLLDNYVADFIETDDSLWFVTMLGIERLDKTSRTWTRWNVEAGVTQSPLRITTGDPRWVLASVGPKERVEIAGTAGRNRFCVKLSHPVHGWVQAGNIHGGVVDGTKVRSEKNLAGPAGGTGFYGPACPSWILDAHQASGWNAVTTQTGIVESKSLEPIVSELRTQR